MKIETLLLATALFLPITTFAKTVTVIVPATASGNFGYYSAASDANATALVKAVTVTKATTIKLSHVDGEWRASDSLPLADANGHDWSAGDWEQAPLQEASGVTGVKTKNLMALVGAFIPKSLVDSSIFTPVDGTKKSRGLGIMPDKLFFVGTDNVIQTNGAGTLYLGVNDPYVSDNSGSLTVEITTP